MDWGLVDIAANAIARDDPGSFRRKAAMVRNNLTMMMLPLESPEYDGHQVMKDNNSQSNIETFALVLDF